MVHGGSSLAYNENVRGSVLNSSLARSQKDARGEKRRKWCKMEKYEQIMNESDSNGEKTEVFPMENKFLCRFYKNKTKNSGQ